MKILNFPNNLPEQKTKHMTKKTTIVASLLALAFTTVAPAADSRLTGSLETKVVSKQDYSDGTPVSAQTTYTPKLSLKYSLFDGGSLFLNAAQELGTKGSTWYRARFHTGAILTVGRLTLVPGYRYVTFPDGGGQNAQSVTLRATFNDAGLWVVALHPYVVTEQFTDPKSGVWYETGVVPGYSYGKLRADVPLSVGIRSSNYQVTNLEQKYAYLGAGVTLSYPLTDRLSVKAGSTYYTTNCQAKDVGTGQWVNQASLAVSF